MGLNSSVRITNKVIDRKRYLHDHDAYAGPEGYHIINRNVTVLFLHHPSPDEMTPVRTDSSGTTNKCID
jgi:hypothetical protein